MSLFIIGLLHSALDRFSLIVAMSVCQDVWMSVWMFASSGAVFSEASFWPWDHMIISRTLIGQPPPPFPPKLPFFFTNQKKKKKECNQHLWRLRQKKRIGATIRIHQQILCNRYEGFKKIALWALAPSLFDCWPNSPIKWNLNSKKKWLLKHSDLAAYLASTSSKW